MYKNDERMNEMVPKIKITDEQLLVLAGVFAAFLTKELKKNELEVLGNLLQALGSLLTTAAAKR
ncbi:MAG: hypothetical protein ACOX4Q_00250 [Syntrophomonadales bacterium]|jgi:hypothetical protein